jgi:hypothetical protein
MSLIVETAHSANSDDKPFPPITFSRYLQTAQT